MTATENWNKLCSFFTANRNTKEDVLQRRWEVIFAETFGYSSLDGEIESRRSIQLGSRERLVPDIIIKSQGEDLFIVELKQETLPVDANLGQLFSYLKQIKCNLGVLICNKICLVDYDYSKADEGQTKIEIEFTPDNPDGVKFVELLSKANFSKGAVKQFIVQKNEFAKNVEAIKQEISDSLATELLRKHFAEKYKAEEFDEAIKEFEIRIESKRFINNSDAIIPTVTSNNNGSAPTIEYFINDKPVNSAQFKEALLKVKMAKRTWYYGDKPPVTKTWDARNMTQSSSLSGNIKSSEYRYWRETNLVKVRCDIEI